MRLRRRFGESPGGGPARAPGRAAPLPATRKVSSHFRPHEARPQQRQQQRLRRASTAKKRLPKLPYLIRSAQAPASRLFFFSFFLAVYTAAPPVGKKSWNRSLTSVVVVVAHAMLVWYWL